MKSTYTSNRIFNFLIFAVILLFTMASTEGATKTWNGSVSTDWGTAGNWSTTGVPTSADDVIIPTNPTGGRFPIIGAGTFELDQLTIQAGATLTQSDGTITVYNNFTINSGTPGGTYNQIGGLLKIDDEWDNYGTFNSAGGTVQFTGDGGEEPTPTFAHGINQFHNIIIDSGVDPGFDNRSGSIIKVSGNFVNNSSNLDNSSNATFIFNGTGDQTIYSASLPVPGDKTFGHLIIDKTSGSTTLLSNISVGDTFTPGFTPTYLNGYLLYVNNQLYNGPLPVELASFSVKVKNHAVLLSWQTATEVNNYGFEIERSVVSNGVRNLSWEKIGFVSGNGNSSSPKSYSFVDDKVIAEKYSYRLKQIDNDGQYEYSKSIEVDLGTPKKYELSQNYPNPFNPTTTIKYKIPESGVVKITLYNILGQAIRTLVNEFKESGVHTINLDASDLNSGMYIYKIESGSFIQTRKMTLLK